MKDNNNSSDWKSSQNKRRISSLISTTLLQIFEVYDDKTVANHLINILRSRGTVTALNKDGTPKYRDPYFIKDEEILKIMENYKEELDNEALERLENNEDE